jgi:hypothetical protein
MKNYTWGNFVEYVSNLIQTKDMWIFRGQANEDWELSTSIQRSDIKPENRLKFEEQMIDQLKRRIQFYLPNELYPTNVIEWLALMQHYGANTRLLDWTKSPYIAAFFAMIDCKEKNSCVWALNVSKLSQIIVDKYPEIFKKIIDEDIKKQNKIYDGMEIKINIEDERIMLQFSELKFDMVFPVYPYKLNERINNQQGMFITQGNIQEKTENCIANVDYDNTGLLLRKICLKEDEKHKILRNLAYMNINYGTLFPGVEGIIKSINNNCMENFI